MTSRTSLVVALTGLALLGCVGNSNPILIDPDAPTTRFVDVSASTLPSTNSTSMDALARDFDGDGDLDLIVAQEFLPNIYLNNLGSGIFSQENLRIPANLLDSEDVTAWDFDEDGDLDVVIVSEDTAENEYYMNDGTGFFVELTGALPATGTSNAVVAADLNGDGHGDLLIGNNGQNVILIGDGAGGFTDETAARLPQIADVTQDLELGDVDGDGDLDVIVGNEGANRLLVNDGTGVWADESAGRLPSSTSETREADFGDVDGDGDLDIVFANVRFAGGATSLNELLLNDGTGTFTDESDRLPPDNDQSVDVDLLDLDEDGDLDVLLANFGDPNRAYLNDGQGNFSDSSSVILPGSGVGPGFDFEAGDYSGDGRVDLYLVNRGSSDRLYVSN